MRISDWSSDVCSSDLTRQRDNDGDNPGKDGSINEETSHGASLVRLSCGRAGLRRRCLCDLHRLPCSSLTTALYDQLLTCLQATSDYPLVLDRIADLNYTLDHLAVVADQLDCGPALGVPGACTDRK